MNNAAQELIDGLNPETLAEVLGEFLTDTGADADCIYCKTNSWSAIPDFVTLSLHLNKTKTPVLALTCNNCGFVRFHSVEIFMDWLKKHPHAGNRNGSKQD